jgi:hypothetical protein
MVVFDTLRNIMLLGLGIGEGEIRFFLTVAGGVGGQVVLRHTAFTGSRLESRVFIITGKNICHFFLQCNVG